MALDDFLISTGVDQLIRLVKERGKVEMSAASSELKLPQKTVEDWAHVLEGEGIVTIEYRLTKIFLVWKEPTREYVAQRSQKLAEKAAGTKTEIEMLLSKVKTEGKQLSSMKRDVDAMAAKPLSAEEAMGLREEIAAIEQEFDAKAAAAAEKLGKLKKKADDAAAKRGESAGGKRIAAYSELKKELSVLKRFEETLNAQQLEAEGAYSALEQKIEETRQQVEANDAAAAAKGMEGEIAHVKELRGELVGAVEALAEEVAAIDARISSLEKRSAEITGDSTSLGSAKKKLSELRRMADEARRQKAAVRERLADSITLVKKQSEKIGEMLQNGEADASASDGMTNEYIDIAEEISRANEELAERQRQVSSKLSAQMAAIESGKSAAKGRFTKEEVEKVSFLLGDLANEQAMLEEKVKVLLKESDILQLEAAPQSAAAKAAAGGRIIQAKAGGSEHAELVERIRISQEDEAEFERKRDELRALIRNMWEESKAGPQSPA